MQLNRYDRDFLMPVEVDKFADPYLASGHPVWFTEHSDIEAYWATPVVVAAHFGITLAEASQLIEDATTRASLSGKAMQKVRKKRNEALLALNRDGSMPQYGDQEVLAEATRDAVTTSHYIPVMVSPVNSYLYFLSFGPSSW